MAEPKLYGMGTLLIAGFGMSLVVSLGITILNGGLVSQNAHMWITIITTLVTTFLLWTRQKSRYSLYG